MKKLAEVGGEIVLKDETGAVIPGVSGIEWLAQSGCEPVISYNVHVVQEVVEVEFPITLKA